MASATELHRGWEAFWELYHAGTWEPWTKAVIDTLQPGDLFVDIGAWIGPVTLWALERGAEAVAIEPDPVAVEELRRNAPDAEVWEGAIATHSSGGFLAVNETPGGEYGDSMSFLAGEGAPVRTFTLQQILDGRTPALVKIDVEGYETRLCPELIPWLSERSIPVQVSLHGTPLDMDLFAGYETVRWPMELTGDVVAR